MRPRSLIKKYARVVFGLPQYWDGSGFSDDTLQFVLTVLNHDTKVGNKSHQTNQRAVGPFLQIKFTNNLSLHRSVCVRCNYLSH